MRPFEEGDYEDIVKINNEIYPDNIMTVEETRHKDAINYESANLRRWVAETDGNMVGYCYFQNMLWDYDPKRFDMGILVTPSCQGRGIGSEVYNYLMKRLSDMSPVSVCCWFRDEDKNIRFLKNRGFYKKQRESISRLDVRSWSEEPYLDIFKRLDSKGIKIITLKDFMLTPDWVSILYDLEREVALDVPGATSVPELAVWKRSVLDSKFFLPEGYFMAVDGDDIIGMSNVLSRPTKGFYEIGLTGVRGAYRGLGIATALKVKCISYLKSIDAATLETGNEENNKLILKINKKLGFKSVPDWLQYEKICKQ